MIIIKNNPIILIDGSFYVHRAYHAFPSFTTSEGNPTWVIYGVVNMIKSLLTRYQPTHMAIVFDTIGKNFRNNLFSQYKAHRNQTPQNLYTQIDPLIEILRNMGLPVFSVPNVEADDVIGTLAVSYAKLGYKILISTGDKDIAQIVSPTINLINTMSNIILNPEAVKNKFGVPPELIIDYLALIGDNADNIPGVPGIGQKTANLLLNEIGNLQYIYAHLDTIYTLNLRRSKSIKNILHANKDIAFLSYKLATIKTDVPLLQCSHSQLLITPPNIDALLSLFKKYEFQKWSNDLKSKKWIDKYQHIQPIKIKKNIKKICKPNIPDPLFCSAQNKKIIKIIKNIDALYKWIKNTLSTKIFALNIYTDTFNIFDADIINICLSIHPSESVYIPIYNNQDFLNIQEILFALQPILENPRIKKIGQNLKFYYSLLQRYNINLVGITFDIIVEFYVLYGTSNYQSIKNFLEKDTCNAFAYFKKIHDNYIHHNHNIDPKLCDIQLRSSQAAELIQSIFNLHNILWPKIQKNHKLKKIFEEIEMPLISILSRIESYGVLIDKNLLNTYSIELNTRLHLLQKQAYQLVGTPFNLSSPKQLQEILYNKHKLPILKKTPKGAPSTNEEVLKKLAKKYPMPKIILQHRGLAKLKSTYTNKLITMINTISHRIHTSYHQTRTSTGRLSSTHPNLQNIPSRNYEGRKIRQAFIAPQNFSIVSADYSQIELRIMAHLSKDLKLINDFLSGIDIHAVTASEIFFTPLHSITHEQRHLAKTINFGLIYGMSAFGLARQLSMTCKEAQKYVNRYFNRYPGIMQYMQYIRNQVNIHGYVSTLNGRKLYLPNIYSNNISQKKSAERAAINAPMQGSAADIMKKAMISIDDWLQKDTIPVRIIMQVHDELVFEIKNTIIDVAVKKIKKLMEECFSLDVPLKVEVGIGKNWEQAH